MNYIINKFDKVFINKLRNNKCFLSFINKLNIKKDSELADKIINILEYEFILKNKIVFKENQKTNLKFYLILNGKIGISKHLKRQYIYNKKLIIIDDINIGHHLKFMNENEFFGEMALLSEDSKRTASIYTVKDCEFITISRENFENLIKNYLFEEFETKKKLYHNIFNGKLSFHFSEVLIKLCKKEKFKKDYILLKKGEKYNKIYFILDGILEFYEKINNFINKDENKKKFKLKYFNENIYLKRLIKYQFFGEDIFFDKNPISNYFIKVKSVDAILYSIKYSKFKNYPEIKSYFRNYFKKLLSLKKSYLISKGNNFVNILYNINNSYSLLENNYKKEKLRNFLNKNSKYITKRKNIIKSNKNTIIFENKKSKYKIKLNKIICNKKIDTKKNSLQINTRMQNFIKKNKKNNSLNLLSNINLDLKTKYINIVS